jgi:hypothetical protein
MHYRKFIYFFLYLKLLNKIFSRSRAARSRHGARVQFHGQTPFPNTTIFIGGQPPHSRHPQADTPDVGTFFQTVLTQLVGGAGGGGGQQFPL